MLPATESFTTLSLWQLRMASGPSYRNFLGFVKLHGLTPYPILKNMGCQLYVVKYNFAEFRTYRTATITFFLFRDKLYNKNIFSFLRSYNENVFSFRKPIIQQQKRFSLLETNRRATKHFFLSKDRSCSYENTIKRGL